MNDMSNQNLLLQSQVLQRRPDLKERYHVEMRRRLESWGIPLPTRTPERVIVATFRRHMRYRESDANGTYIPPDRVENAKVDYDTDWFISEDDEEDLFKI